MDLERTELHIYPSESGHESSSDCWCEPNRCYWLEIVTGDAPVFIIEHEDNHDKPDKDDLINTYQTIIQFRIKNRDWVSQILQVPLLLPPHQDEGS